VQKELENLGLQDVRIKNEDISMIKNASKDTNFGKADSILSRLSSELRQLDRSREEGYEDMRLFNAPSECGELIEASYRRQRRELFKKYQIDEYDYFEFVGERISSRWIHYNISIY